MAKISILKKAIIPHIIVDNILELHPALDLDTGHIICHYKQFHTSIVKVDEFEFPAIGIGECMTIIPGDEAYEKVREATAPLKVSTIPPIQLRREINSLDLASALSLISSNNNIEFRKNSNGEIILLVEGEHRFAIVLAPCKEKEKGRSPILQV